VSGPLKGRAPAPVGPAAPGRQAPPRARPRPEAPSRRRSRRLRRAAKPASNLSLGARAIAFVRALPDHPWLDRAVRGRAWIAILGVMLAGIVAMQVEVLKLGASIGRSIQRSTTLQARNEQLRATVGSLDDDQRIEAMAAKHGMVMPAPDSVGFLSAGQARHVSRVLAGIRAPDAGMFLALTTNNGSVTTGAGTDPTAAASAAGAGSATTATGTDTSAGSGTSADTGTSAATTTDTQSAAAQAATPSTSSQGTSTSSGG
jgi:hypothetical protein